MTALGAVDTFGVVRHLVDRVETFPGTKRAWKFPRKRRFGSVKLVQNEAFFALFHSFTSTAFHA